MKVRTVLWHLSYNDGLITLLILYVTKGQTWDDCQNVFPLISKRESFTKNQLCAVHHVFLHFRWITVDVLKNYYDEPRVLKWINNQKIKNYMTVLFGNGNKSSNIKKEVVKVIKISDNSARRKIERSSKKV